MNNFNPDQNPHILSSPESMEGGTGGGNGKTNQAEQENSELRGEVLEGQSNVEEGEVDSLDLPPLESEDVQAPSDETLTKDLELPPLEDELNFDINSETGLSKALTEIENLQTQIQAVEEGGARYQEIKSQIETERSIEKTNLEKSLQENEIDLNQLYTDIFIKAKAKGEFTGSEAQKSTIDEYLEKHKDNTVVSSIKTKFDTYKKQIQELTATLATFDIETESQIQARVQAEKGTLQESLSKAQKEYSGSDAEANDKKVSLERHLKEQLTDPNQLFSQQNIDQIFATYGIKEGLEKLEELKQESDQAREQAARDEIRKDIMSRVDLYNQIPELAEALSTDIQTKLEALQESNPDSETLSQALSLEGAAKLDYLTNSGDTQLQGLAFWFDRDSDIDQVIVEYPQFAQYLAKETDKRYEQQQQAIKSGRTDGQQYLGSRMDNTRRVEIDNRISAQLESFRITKIEELQGELSSLKYDETGRDYDTQDRAILSEKEQLRPADINQFQTELQQALESGQIKFEQGQFSILENIPEKQKEIDKQLKTLFDTIQPVLKEAGYTLQSLEFLSSIPTKIEQDQEKAKNKPLGFGKKQAEALAKLLKEVASTIEQYNTLQADKQKNAEQFENNNQSISKLKESYQKLPQSIQNNLSSLENRNFETINQTIDTGVESIQNYQTPPEIVEKRSQIQALESEIAETQAITSPSSGTQSSV
jgi:hypothetical protein